jgi:hypothetical protein
MRAWVSGMCPPSVEGWTPVNSVLAATDNPLLLGSVNGSRAGAPAAPPLTTPALRTDRAVTRAGFHHRLGRRLPSDLAEVPPILTGGDTRWQF